MQVKKQQLEACMEQLIGSRLRKEYDSAVCYHPACLNYILSTLPHSSILAWKISWSEEPGGLQSSPWRHKMLDPTELLNTQQHMNLI